MLADSRNGWLVMHAILSRVQAFFYLGCAAMVDTIECGSAPWLHSNWVPVLCAAVGVCNTRLLDWTCLADANDSEG